MASVTKENLGNLHDKLTVKVSKEDYLPAFEKAIKDYSKKANIPGFRKGMVPAGMIKKMHGSSIFYDEVIKSVENELKNYLSAEKPQIFAQPLPLQSDQVRLDMNHPEEYDFPFEVGLKPAVSLDALQSAKTTFYKVKVTPEMVEEEIEKILTKNGDLKDAEAVSSDENVLNVQFEESDAEGNAVPDGIKKDDSILLKYFSPAYREKLMDKKVGDFVVLQLKDAFDEKEREWIAGDLELNKEEADSADRYFKMTISKIGLVEKKELNEEFFKLAFPSKDVKTEEEFREAFKEEIQKQWDDAARNQLHDQLYHILVETPLEFPVSFLKRWLEIGTDKQKTPEEVEAEYPRFESQLKWTLITDKIIEENKLEVNEADLRGHIKNQLISYMGGTNLDEDAPWLDSYIDRMMQDEKQVDASYRKIITDKIFTWLESQVHPEEKEISSQDFLKMQEEHHHHH